MSIFEDMMTAAEETQALPSTTTMAPTATMPVMVAKRCMRHLHQASSCKRCLEACPSDALRIVDGQLKLHVPACTGCGFCASVCPTEGLLMPTSDVTTETQAYAAAKASGTLVVSCADCAKKRGLTVPCLHSLDFSRLVDAVAKGVSTIELVRGNCDKCPKCIPGTSLIDTCQTLEAFAGQFEKTLSVVLETSTKDVDLSRRRFFGGLLRRADIGTKPASPDVVADVKATATETSQRLPASRERLVEALRTLSSGHTEALDTSGAARLFVAPVIEQTACTACGICAEVCPTKALTMETGEKTVLLKAIKAHCIGCGLCSDVCYRYAVTIAPVKRMAQLLEEKPDVIMAKLKGEDAYSTWEDRLGSMVDAPVYRT